MSSATRPSLNRLIQLNERQGGKPRWGKDYQPANRVTALEAPPKCRPSGILASKLDGRYLVAQSKVERAALLLALYNPCVFEIHEQKVLSADPAPHPLFGHPLAIGLDLPPLAGTVAVADRIGCLSRHPKIRMQNESNPSEYFWVPFPFIGDSLLYLQDETDPFCVNWTIKKDEKSFQLRMPGNKPVPKEQKPNVGQLQRHEIEEIYYLDGLIPTYRITLDKIDKEVRINLLNLHNWYARPTLNLIDDEKKEHILNDYDHAIGSEVVQFELAKLASKKHSVDFYDAKLILKQGIWSRRLRVNMFEPILDNGPLNKEKKDVLDVYAHWFARTKSP